MILCDNQQESPAKFRCTSNFLGQMMVHEKYWRTSLIERAILILNLSNFLWNRKYICFSKKFDIINCSFLITLRMLLYIILLLGCSGLLVDIGGKFSQVFCYNHYKESIFNFSLIYRIRILQYIDDSSALYVHRYCRHMLYN